MANKFWRDIKPPQRRSIEQGLDDIRRSTIQQRSIIQNSIISALNERLVLIQDFLRGDISVQHFTKRNKYLSEYVTSFFKKIEKNEK